LPTITSSGAQAEDQRLDRDAEGLGQRADQAAPAAGACLQPEHLALAGEPALAQAGQHPHGHDRIDIAQAALGLVGGIAGLAVRLRQVGARGQLAPHRQQHQQQRRQHGHGTKPRVEQEHHTDVQGQPRRVEKGEEPGPGEELPQLEQVTQRLGGCHLAAAGLRLLEDGLEGAAGEQMIEPRTGHDQDLRAHPFEPAHQDEQEDRHQRQHEQRRFAAAAEYPVVDLQHVQRRHQQQHIDEEAEKARGKK
jgi:hypothetical protein